MGNTEKKLVLNKAFCCESEAEAEGGRPCLDVCPHAVGAGRLAPGLGRARGADLLACEHPTVCTGRKVWEEQIRR